MFQRRRGFNPKRRLADATDKSTREVWATEVGYGGNPEHKRNPGDFRLTPPASPRPDKTLCDAVLVWTRADAVRLLRSGIEKGLVSVQQRGGYPQNVWAVTDQGHPVEAQLENADRGIYHGYPMPASDPLRQEILARWMEG